MKHIGNGEKLIDFLSDEYSLLSSRISRIDIFSHEEYLMIEIYIDLLYSKNEKTLKIKFIDIEMYSFFYCSDYYFYTVENYKLFATKKGFYVSFDPHDDGETISPEDQDFIACKAIEGYLT